MKVRPVHGISVPVGVMCVLMAMTTAVSAASGDPGGDESRPEGFTEPIETIQVAAAQTGVVEDVLVREGDSVQAGDVIAKLRSDVLIASRHATQMKLQSRGKRDAAAATLAHRQNHLAQLVALRAKNHASEQEVAEAEFDVRIAEAQLQSVDDDRQVLHAELKQIEAQIAQREIRAPIDGVITHLPVKTGERVGAADEPVAELVRLTSLRVRFHVKTFVAAKLTVGAATRVHFPGVHETVDAMVDFIAPTTDSSSGTVRVEVLIDNESNQHRAGIRCRLSGVSEPRDASTFATLLKGVSFFPIHPNQTTVGNEVL